MAEFILGNPLSSAARKYPVIQRALWRVDFAMVWLLIKTFSLLPPDTASNLGAALGGWIGPRLRRKTEMFRENFSLAFPETSEAEREQLIQNAWRSAGRILADFPHFENIYASRDRERLHVEILDPTLNFAEDCPPIVVVTAHHCNWEVIASGMLRVGLPSACPYTPPSNPLLDRMLMDSRKKLGCQVVPRDNAARGLMRSLKQGRSAGMVVDRRIDDGKPVRFFGRDKPSSLLPAKLALKFGIHLVPVSVERIHGAEFRINFHSPVCPSNPDAGEDEQAIDMMSQVHTLFEDWIRERPEDWFCPKRIWPKPDSSSTGTSADDREVNSYAA